MAKKQKELRMKQLLIAPWQGGTGLTYSTLALGTDGIVYRYDPKCGGWLKFPMKLTDQCEIGRDHKR